MSIFADSESSDSSACGGPSDQHVFRATARSKPGYIFFKNAADARATLGQRHMDRDVSQRGGIHRRWLDGYFEPRNRAKLGPRQSELMELLVTALDCLVGGRGLEAGDILASQLRSLVTGVETGEWKLAKEMLAYRKVDNSLIDDETMEAALKEADRTAKRLRRIADLSKKAAGGGRAAR